VVTVLQAGVVRSGNYWLYRILRAVLREAGMEHRSFLTGTEFSRPSERHFPEEDEMDFLSISRTGFSFQRRHLTWQPVGDIREYVRRCSQVWTHSRCGPRLLEIRPLFDGVIYVIRDPRDVAISLSYFAYIPLQFDAVHNYDRDPVSFLRNCFDGVLRDWVTHVGGYLRYARVLRMHVVFYERWLHAFDDELKALTDYLGMRLSDGAQHRVREEVGFATMREHHPLHLRRGTRGQWRDALDERQKAVARTIAGPMLRLLGYGDEEELPALLPRLPSPLDPAEIDRAVAHSRRTRADELRRIAAFALSDRSLRAKGRRVLNWLREGE